MFTNEKIKVLLVGGSGMVGKNILEQQVNTNIEFVVPSSSELNLLESESVRRFFENSLPDIIIHAAARVGGIQSNISEPIAYFEDNLKMGLNLITAAKEFGVKELLNIGSSCMYPCSFLAPIKESDLLTGSFETTNEAYALSKVSIAKYCEYITNNTDLNYKTIIPCNLYGKFDKFGDQNSHMVAAVIKKISQAKLQNDPFVEIWGDGSARREFMFAGDFAKFIVYALQNFEKIPQYLNVGVGGDNTILEYYQIISEAIGYTGEFKFKLDAPVGMKRKLVSIEKLREIGWEATTDIKRGILMTIDYYKTL